MKKSHSVRTIILAGTLLLQLNTLCFRARGAAGDVDLSFDPGSGVNGTVNAIAVQPDGKVIIGGQFTTVKGLVRTNLARLNADGSGDSSFTAGPFTAGSQSYTVLSLALQSDGKVLVGHEGGNYGLIRLNSDGSADTNFNTNAYAAIASTGPYYPVRITSIVVQPDGKLLYAGEHLLRLNDDGTLDNTFSSALGGYLDAMARQSDGRLIVGGYFYNNQNGSYSYGLVRLNSNGSPDNSFNAPVSGYVYSIVLQPDGKVLFGGLLTSVNGTNYTPIARLHADGSVDATFGLVSGTGLGVGGGGLRAVVDAISLQSDGKVIIGGQFDSINGSTRKNLARLNADGTLDQSFPNGAGGVSGFPMSYPGTSVKAIAWQPDGQFLIGGAFTTVNGTNRNRVARLNADGSLDDSFHPGRGVDNPTYTTVIAPDGKVLIGGGRTVANGGGTFAMIARLHANGSPDSGFNPGTGANGVVVAVAAQPDGKVLIGGSFTQVNGVDKLALARLNADGSVDTNFYPALAYLGYESIPHPYGGEHATAVTAIHVLADGKLLVAGYGATQVTGEDVFYVSINFFLEKLNADGSHAAGFNTAGGPGSGSATYFYGWDSVSPSSIAIQPDGRILVGGVARLHADGTVDASFVPGTVQVSGLSVSALALQPDGKVLAGGGYFGIVNGVGRHGIVRFNSDGSMDSTFAAGVGTDAVFSSSINAVSLQPDGKVLIGGSFTTFDGTNRKRIARLNSNGTLDASFNPGTGTDGNIRSLTLQPDGNVLIGGDFLTVNGVLRPYVARLYGDSAPSLNIARSNAFVIVSWPFPSTGFVLQQNTDLNPANWTTPSETVSDNGTTRSISVSPAPGTRFYRLFKP